MLIVCLRAHHWQSQHHLQKANIIHLCPSYSEMMLSQGSNDVVCKHANDIVSYGHKLKIRKHSLSDFGGSGWIVRTSILAPTKCEHCEGPRANDSPPGCLIPCLRQGRPSESTRFVFPKDKKSESIRFRILVGAGGFGPPKSLTTDLQSAPFGRSGTLPFILLSLSQH